eukprot:365824-Chlamydomonas_euryale.AAC.3
MGGRMDLYFGTMDLYFGTMDLYFDGWSSTKVVQIKMKTREMNNSGVVCLQTLNNKRLGIYRLNLWPELEHSAMFHTRGPHLVCRIVETYSSQNMSRYCRFPNIRYALRCQGRVHGSARLKPAKKQLGGNERQRNEGWEDECKWRVGAHGANRQFRMRIQRAGSKAWIQSAHAKGRSKGRDPKGGMQGARSEEQNPKHACTERAHNAK